jgi:phospho-N-acetylmuramoyl-pentapeptide-transferase
VVNPLLQMGIALILALLATLLVGGSAIGWLHRIGLARGGVREDTPQAHQAKRGTPSMGGIFMIPCAAGAMLIAGLGDRLTVGVALSMLCFSAIGAADDLLKARRPSRRGLLARSKLLLQAAAASALIAYAMLVMGKQGTVAVAPYLAPLSVGAWAVPVWMIFVLWLTNAVNITDGLDGLAAGLGALACLPIALAGSLSGLTGAGVAAGGLLGGLAGFLRFNHKPAQVWMGDTGSLGLGGGLAALAILGSMEWLVLLATLPFTVELLSDVIQVAYFQGTKRLYHLAEGRRVFRKAPLHHHFEEGGTSEARVVLGFWVFGAACAAVSVGLLLGGGLP